jgi:hypothetical protein
LLLLKKLNQNYYLLNISKRQNRSKRETRKNTREMEVVSAVVSTIVEPIVSEVKIFAREQARGLSNVAWRNNLTILLEDLKMKKLDLLLSVDGAQTFYNLERILEIMQTNSSNDLEKNNTLNEQLKLYIDHAEQSSVRAREMSKSLSLDSQLLACRTVCFIRLLKLSCFSSLPSSEQIKSSETSILEEFKQSFETMLMKKYGDDILVKSLQWEAKRQLYLRNEEYWEKSCAKLKSRLTNLERRLSELQSKYPELSDCDWWHLNSRISEDFVSALFIVTIYDIIHAQYWANKYKISSLERTTILDYKTSITWLKSEIEKEEGYRNVYTKLSIDSPSHYNRFGSEHIYATVIRLLKKQQAHMGALTLPP